MLRDDATSFREEPDGWKAECNDDTKGNRYDPCSTIAKAVDRY